MVTPAHVQGKLRRRLEWAPEETAFIASYLRHRDPRRAYLEAGFPEPQQEGLLKRARKIMARAHLKAYLAEKTAELDEHLMFDAEKVLRELVKIGFFNIAKLLVHQADGTAYVDMSLLEAHDAVAIQEITTDVYMDGDAGRDPDSLRQVKRLKVKLAPKTPALELLGKHLKLWTDKLEIEATVDVADRVASARRKAGTLIEGTVNYRRTNGEATKDAKRIA